MNTVVDNTKNPKKEGAGVGVTGEKTNKDEITTKTETAAVKGNPDKAANQTAPSKAKLPAGVGGSDGTVINCQFDQQKMDNLILEANEMALYVSRDGKVLGDDGAALHLRLLDAIKNATCKPDATSWVELHCAYAAVTAKTYPVDGVNGKTILDTRKEIKVWRSIFFLNARYRPVGVGILLFVLAMLLQMLGDWATENPSAKQSPNMIAAISYFVATSSLFTFLIPAVWGGIGSCIFLAKRLSDKLFDQAYESSKVKGDMTRIFLGAMLGVIVVVVLFNGESIEAGGFTFGPAAAAFIAGLGVKPIYAAFESLSEELAARVNRNKVKPTKPVTT